MTPIRAKNRGRKPIEWIVAPSGCWECTSHPLRDGYPTIAESYTTLFIHRFLYAELFGSIPPGLIVRHKCDNRLCINPEHLLLGTHADNMRDRAEHGRSARGSRHGRATLNEVDVAQIKERIRAAHRTVDIARDYGVGPSAIYSIRIGRTWKEVAG